MASVTDTFTDADGTNLQSHTPDSGGTWTAVGGSTMLQINTNRLYASTSAAMAVYYNTAAAGVDQDIQADFVCVTSGSVTPGIAGRVATTGNNGYFADYHTQWTLWERVSGTITSIGTYAGDAPTAASKVGKLEIRDATKKVFVDGVERISSTNNGVTAAGYFGAFGYYATNFTSRYIDNYSAADAAGATTTRGTPFGARGTAFNGGRTFWGIIRRVLTGLRTRYA